MTRRKEVKTESSQTVRAVFRSSGITPLHLGDRQMWWTIVATADKAQVRLWTVKLKAQMSIITAFTIIGGHKVLRWLCQRRESPWWCVYVSPHNAYIGVYVRVCAKQWLTPVLFLSFLSGLRRKGDFFCLQQLLRQSASSSVSTVSQKPDSMCFFYLGKFES